MINVSFPLTWDFYTVFPKLLVKGSESDIQLSRLKSCLMSRPAIIYVTDFQSEQIDNDRSGIYRLEHSGTLIILSTFIRGKGTLIFNSIYYHFSISSFSHFKDKTLNINVKTWKSGTNSPSFIHIMPDLLRFLAIERYSLYLKPNSIV